ncbi:adhesion G-protein coupled receptor G2-like [Acanthopagrus schlegelii]
MRTFTHSPNVTATTTNFTTTHNVTTVDHNSTTTETNTTMSTFTHSPNVTATTTNFTTAYNVTTVDHNSTTTETNTTMSTLTHSPNVTATTTNFTTVYNVTTVDNNSTTTEANTTVSTFTHSLNVTATTNNFTTEYNVTTVDYNNTIAITNATMSTFTPFPNYTMVSNLTTVSSNFTTVENIPSTTVSQNRTTTGNVTTSPSRETEQNTTVFTTVSQVVNNTTKPTSTPQNNQNGNYTTPETDKITDTNQNGTNSTTVATGTTPTMNHSQTTGIRFTMSSTTKGPRVNSATTAASNSVEHITTTSETTTNSNLPVQINTTTPEVSTPSSTTALQVTTLTSSTTAESGAETTVTSTAETTQSQEEQEEQANELLSQTQDASQLNSSQVAQVTEQLEKLLDGPTVSRSVGQKAISVISNLMEGDSLAISESANRLVRLVDEVGLKLVVVGDNEIASSNSLVLAVRTVDGTNFPTTSVDIFNTDNVQLRALSRSRSKRSGSALGSVFLPSSLTSGLSPEQQQQASRVQFTFYTSPALFQDSTLDNQTTVSPVLGSSVANLSISNLNENIQFTIRNVNPITVNFSASCAFWDFAKNGGRGGWSTTGCFLVNATQEDTTCSCNHLTAFAILLDLSRDGLTDRQQAQILTFITYIGCGISAIFLSVTLLTYLCFEKLLRDIPAKILVQLCMSLLLLNLVFLLDGWLALYPAIGLCISTAFFLHYFLLTSFTWAGLEALHMYLSVVQVFTPYLSRYMLKFSLVGWGIPLLVVIIIISVDKNNYGLVTYGRYTDGTTDDFCWLRDDIAFYVGVVAYFLLIFSLCLLVFILVMVQLARIKKQNPQNQSPNRGVMTDVRSIAGLVILLGLTWGFALFAWGPLYLPFVYLFTIFNTLQGFLVFVFHCAVKENVRRQWRTYLCCGKLRLAENSEWSRTATQNRRNLSLNTTTTRALHSTSRSSSVISDATNSSGSVFADSGISDGSSSDVVLNEIHRRNMSLAAVASSVHASSADL